MIVAARLVVASSDRVINRFVCFNFRRMRDEESLIDITFACEGKKIGAHKLVLYSCSPYFKDLLKENQSAHPIFFFHDISYDILKAILEYMYLGEVHITNDNLKEFIRVAEALQIRGLSKDTSTTVSEGLLLNRQWIQHISIVLGRSIQRH